jgi:hypothetical protein
VLYATFTNAIEFSSLKRIPRFYQQILCGLNSAKSIKKTETLSELNNMFIWGNVCLKRKINGTLQTLYLKNWIDSGVMYVGQLRFINGKICMNYLNTLIRRKNNILAEAFIIQQCLNPYKQLLTNKNQIDFMPTNNKILLSKSKQYYSNILLRISGSFKLQKWAYRLSLDIPDTELNNIFNRKIKQIIDKKLSEFNYKILHNILVCDSYLAKFTNTNKMCNICNKICDILHLLYECKISQQVWHITNNALTQYISPSDIVLGR